MQKEYAMDHALATDGYYFSSEPFLAQPTIEATQLACLLDINYGSETILEARTTNDTNCEHFSLNTCGVQVYA